jgi:hypothetical protein
MMDQPFDALWHANLHDPETDNGPVMFHGVRTPDGTGTDGYRPIVWNSSFGRISVSSAIRFARL